MKKPTEDSKQVVDGFLGKLGEPVSPLQVERAIGRVRNRLEEPEALNLSERQPVRRVSRRVMPWIAVAAAILAVVVGGAMERLLLRPAPTEGVAKAVRGQIYLAGVQPLLPLASRIESGQSIRTGTDAGTIEMLDGSRIEMGPQAELSIVPSVDGMSVQLNAGTVIVSAAKQRHGHLYVKTKDLVVSVVGTVFSVSTETSGSRVSVIEGEVHVQQGATEQTLLPGQQASTSPALGPMPVQTELGWSKQAPELAALMQQSVPAAPAVQAPASQAPSFVIQGTVKLANKSEPLQGVDVVACPAGVAAFSAGRQAYFNNQNAGQIRTDLRPTDAGAPASTGPPASPIVKNKTFFFALWDGQCPSPLGFTKTDAAGRFQIKGLSAGEYVVRAQLEGYFGPAIDGRYPPVASQSVTLDSQQPAADVALSLMRGGSISGHVRDAEGKLQANFSVTVGTMASGNALSVVSTKVTDDRGEYRLFSLPPGEYFVSVGSIATPGGIFRYYVGWNATPPNGTRVFGNPTFFPNASSPNDATPIVLKEGEDVSNIDIVLRPPMPTDAPIRRMEAPVRPLTPR